MKIDSQTHGSLAVLKPDGPLASDAVTYFREYCRSTIDQRSGRVVLDFADVPYLDSAGIAALSELCAQHMPGAAQPRMANLGETCREALDLTNVLESLIVFDTVENAMRSFKR